MVTAPYLYGHAANDSQAWDPFQSSFDPKAYTRASWQPAPVPRSKPQGPLLNFNRHPDSYLMTPYGNTNAQPLPPNTCRNVIRLRRIQLALRVLEMIGALGLLFCVITLKNVNNSSAYITRAAPGVDILTTGYAIYHLARAAKSRPPISSASYHLFALVIDIGLIPFYVFTSMVARTMQDTAPGDSDRWNSFFDLDATNKIILATWLISIVLGSLHLLSSGLSLYLVYIFKKIANLPPDMNPLENNLTSRRSRKHKYKNSEISAPIMSEPKHMSTQSLAASDRSFVDKEAASATTRPVSFLHTRTDSDQFYSPHNPATAAAASRTNLAVPNLPAMYQQPGCARTSQYNVAQADARSDGHSTSPTKYSHRFMSEPSTRAPTMTCASSVYTSQTAATKSTEAPAVPRKSSRRASQNVTSDNWFVHNDFDGDDGDLGARPSPAYHQVDQENAHPGVHILEDDFDPYRHDAGMPSEGSTRGFNFGLRNLLPNSLIMGSQPTYSEVAQRPVSPAHTERTDDSFLPVPLGMNPPTPEPDRTTFVPDASKVSPDRRRAPPAQPFTSRAARALSITSGNQPKAPAKSQSANTTPKKSIGTPTKVRYYGDLTSAMAGVRGQYPQPSPQNSPTKPSKDAAKPERRDWAESADGGSKGRVVSKTGADANAGLWDGWGGQVVNRRNVSGKVAEEGRAGPAAGGWRQWAR